MKLLAVATMASSGERGAQPNRLMALAERALREENQHVATVAQTLGYTSESAFSTAFKRETGKSPKAWRLAVRGEVGRGPV